MKVLVTGHLRRARAARSPSCWSRAATRSSASTCGPGTTRPRAQVVQTDIRKRPAEDVFRTQRPDAMIHMATVTHLTHRSQDRYRINLGGTQAVFQHCHTYGVKQAIFVGRHTYYGAGPDSPLYHTESEPPMAVHTFQELSDLVAADLYAGSALWRYPDLDTAVLRLLLHARPAATGHARRVSSRAAGAAPCSASIRCSSSSTSTTRRAAIVLAPEHGLRGVLQRVPGRRRCRCR